MTLTDSEADRLRTVHSNLSRCVSPDAITAHMGATAEAWKPLSDDFAAALAEVTALHRERLAGGLDAAAADAAVERIVMAGTGAMEDMSLTWSA